MWNQFFTRFAENLSNQICRTYWLNPSRQPFSYQNWRGSYVLSVSLWDLRPPQSPFSLESPSLFPFSLSNPLLLPHHRYPPKTEPGAPLGSVPSILTSDLPLHKSFLGHSPTGLIIMYPHGALQLNKKTSAQISSVIPRTTR